MGESPPFFKPDENTHEFGKTKMLKKIRLEDAEKRFLELVRMSAQGDEFVVMTDEGPLVKIIPFQRTDRRQLGTAKGKVLIKKGFKDIPAGFEDYIS